MKKEDFLNQKWYVQEFNGTPFVLLPCGSSAFCLDKSLGKSFKKIMYSFSEERGKMFYPVDDLELLRDILLEKIASDRNFLRDLRKRYEDEFGRALQPIESISSEQLQESTNGEILNLLKKAINALYHAVGQAHCVEAFALTMDEKIKAELAKHCTSEKELNMTLSILCAPSERSFVNEREEDLYTISLVKEEKEREKEIERHIQKFFWIRNTYAGKAAITKEEVKKEVETVKAFKATDIEDIRRKKKELMDKLSLPDDIILLLQASDLLTTLQDNRKKNILIVIDYAERILGELSKRCGIEHKLLRYLSVNEVNEELINERNREENEKMLKTRRDGVIFLTRKDEEEILVNEEYHVFLAKLEKQEKEKSQSKEIMGLCASMGTAVGRVKVCRTEANIKDVKEGDILVTSMTRPEFVPAMKRAAAIVTDEGGITSHAAIVARELGKPCVIGTKVATKVLSDGMLVEVRANHGLVKIIEETATRQELTICWIRHGERQDRTDSSGITEDSYKRLAEIGQKLGKGFTSFDIIHSPKKRAAESAKALAEGIAQAGNKEVAITESSDVDELPIDEKYQKNAEGQRISGGEHFEQLRKGVRLSTKESNEAYVVRLVNFHNEVLEHTKKNTLVIIVHHDFGLDLVLRELLKPHNIPYESNGQTRFQREEYVKYVYENNAEWKLKSILLPTRGKKYEMESQTTPNLNFLKDFKWELMYRENANVLATFMALDCRTARMDRTVGTNFKAFAGKIDNNFFTFYMNPDDCRRVSKFILQRILNEKDWVDHVSQKVYEKARELLTFSRSLKNRNYADYSNQQLLELYREFCTRFMAMRVYSSIPANLEHGTNVFTECLQERLRAYVKNNEEANEAFSILTTPNKDSYIREQELSLLRTGAAWSTPEFERRLEEHANMYTWKNYAFEGVPLKKDDFRKELNDLREKGTDFNAELKKVEDYHTILKNKQAALIAKYKIDDELQRLFSHGKEFVFIKFFRKGTFAESYYSVEFLLNAIAERLRTDLKTIRGMLFGEVREALLDSKLNKQKIEERMRNGFFISIGGKTFDLPEEYRKFVLDNVRRPDTDERSEWKGQTACAGNATGQVKVINEVKDMEKMNGGDILVSRSTNPNLVPAMKKAAAIVTELGGLTCHAAIVSREWGTPCVVGIDHITEMLKDGDFVEVQATKGVVRRIRK